MPIVCWYTFVEAGLLQQGYAIACFHGVGKHPAVIDELIICLIDGAKNAMQSFSGHVGSE